MRRSRRILITGGAGFIGTNLASRLVDGNEILLFDNLWRNSFKNSHLPSSNNITLSLFDDMNRVR